MSLSIEILSKLHHYLNTPLQGCKGKVPSVMINLCREKDRRRPKLSYNFVSRGPRVIIKW